MPGTDLKAVLYSPDYVKLGVLPLTGGRALLRRNETSTFALDVNGDHEVASRWKRGCRVVLMEGDQQFLAGPTLHAGKSRDGGARDFTISGVCDLTYLRWRLSYPNPAQSAQSQTAGYWRATGPAETVIRDLVRLNVGQNALAERRALVVEPSQGRGGTVTANSRFKPVLDEAHSMAQLGNVTFRTWQDGKITRFGFREQKDLTRSIRLTYANGGVTKHDMGEDAPGVTHVYVAGQGEGEARTIRVVPGSNEGWGMRIEEFRDRRDTDEVAELIAAGQERLAEGRASASVTFEAGDSPQRRFLTHFNLGDPITVGLSNDGLIQDIVQSADMSWGAQGRTTKLQVGPHLSEEDAPPWLRVMDAFRRDVDSLKTR